MAAAAKAAEAPGSYAVLIAEEAKPGTDTVPASGVDKVLADPQISQTKLYGVAFARSLVLTALLGGALGALVPLWRVSLLDRPSESDIGGTLTAIESAPIVKRWVKSGTPGPGFKGKSP